MGKIKRTISQILATAGPPRGGTHIEGADPYVSVPDRTAAVARGLEVILRHHEATEGVVREILEQSTRYLNASVDEKGWVKRFKYFSARPLAEYLRNELPPCPEPFEFTGLARKWTRNRLRCFNRKNTHLWYSWFQSKRCCLPSSDEFLEDTYKDHLTSLTRKDPGQLSTIDAAFSNPTFLGVLNQLRRGLSSCVEASASRWSASISACFERTRSRGGQHRTLEELSLMTTESSIAPLTDFDLIRHTSVLLEMRSFEHIEGFGRGVIERRESCGREDWESLNALSWSYSWWNAPLSCEIKGVIEPLKVRVISKGEALPYFSQRWLQKGLHDQMRRMPCFRLLGRPVCSTDLVDIWQSAAYEDEWFSIDYSAATDGLSWSFSSRILAFLLQDFSPVILKRALKVLGPHRLYYPVQGGREFRGTQSNGQLMGSILSFPILCLANLATYLLTVWEHRRGWRADELLRGVLVNGDDMVYAADRSLWPLHCRISNELGLSMSVGKAYHHDRYANINSTSFIYPLRRESLPMEVPYLNVGLYFQTAVQKKMSTDVLQEREEENELRVLSGLPPIPYPEEGVTACLSKLLEGCLNERKRSEVLVDYLKRNKSAIQDESRIWIVSKGKCVKSFRNLFLHPSCGGMGVYCPAAWKFRLSTLDRRIAYGFAGPLASVRPTPGPQPMVWAPPREVWEKRDLLSDIPLVVLSKRSSLDRASLIRGVVQWRDNGNTLVCSPSDLVRSLN